MGHFINKKESVHVMILPNEEEDEPQLGHLG